MNIKNILVGAATGGLMCSAIVLPVFASSSGNGSDYGNMPGYTVATSETTCSGAGAFDAFGQNFNFGNPTSGHVPYPGNIQNGNGANGALTGSNNSNLCGNPQGNP